LYIGVTTDLVKRVYEHKNDLLDGFTKKYGVHTLVYYESQNNIELAIKREKQLKNWHRKWKLALIERSNPDWRDLYNDIVSLDPDFHQDDVTQWDGKEKGKVLRTLVKKKLKLKKPMYKLLVIDIDGTLLNRENRVSAADIAAVQRAAATGIGVSLCTGRVPQGCRHILAELGLDGCHIFFDGALVFNPFTREEIDSVPISPALVRQTTLYTRENQLHYDVYSRDTFYSQGNDWATAIRRSFFQLEPVTADFDELSRRERIIKGTVVTRTPEERARAAAFQSHFKGRLDCSWTTTPAFPEVHFINVINPAVNKGNALEKLCRHLQIPPEQVMAIGDGLNDISLLQKAGLAVAMGNGAPELKAVAHFETQDADNSGVAAAITQHLGI